MKVYSSFVLLKAALLLLCLTLNSIESAKGLPQTGSGNSQQPLSNLDKIVRQTNGLRIDSILDNKMASNVTSTLNEMAMNLRKMILENRRLSSQVQEVLVRVQNVTGLNATSAVSNLQQQASSVPNISNPMGQFNVSSLMSRSQTV